MMLLEVPESHGGSRVIGQFVQGLPPDELGARLMNVAVSRAQERILVFANLTYLDKRLPSSSLLRGVLFQHPGEGQDRVQPAGFWACAPIESDLAGLIGNIPFDEVAEGLCIFDEAQFEQGLMRDIHAAPKSIVLFSGYITPARVGKLGDLLRWKITNGVKVRCITRPPKMNGSIPEAAGRAAIEMLEGIGAVVDCRARIHQKVCLIDNRIVWWGSLNALSHMYHADETMTRVVNDGFAQVVIAHMSKRPISVEKAATGAADAGTLPVGLRHPDGLCRWITRSGFVLLLRGRLWLASGQQTTRRPIPDVATRRPEFCGFAEEGPICPSCGGETRLRHGPYGVLYSCARYPACDGKVPLPKTRPLAKRSPGPRAAGRSN